MFDGSLAAFNDVNARGEKRRRLVSTETGDAEMPACDPDDASMEGRWAEECACWGDGAGFGEWSEGHGGGEVLEWWRAAGPLVPVLLPDSPHPTTLNPNPSSLSAKSLKPTSLTHHLLCLNPSTSHPGGRFPRHLPSATSNPSVPTTPSRTPRALAPRP